MIDLIEDGPYEEASRRRTPVIFAAGPLEEGTVTNRGI